MKSYKKFIQSKFGTNHHLINNDDNSGTHWKIGINQQTTKNCEKAEQISLIKLLSENENKVNKKKEEASKLEQLKTNSLPQQTDDASSEAKRLSEFNKSSTKLWEAINNKSSIIAFETTAKILDHDLSQDTMSNKYVLSQINMPIDESIKSTLPQEKTQHRKLFHPLVDHILRSLNSDSLNLIKRYKSERSPLIYLK